MKKYKQVEQGAERYVVGGIEPNDQKNQMFKQPFWDAQMLDLGERFYRTPVLPKDKPGYRLQDQSLVNASWRLENEFARGVRGGRMGFYDWHWDGHLTYPSVPPGLTLMKIDPAANTRGVKKAASFFGASKVKIFPGLPVANTSLLPKNHYSVWFEPAGLMTQGTRYGDHCSLLRVVGLIFKTKRQVFLVHRLDREASDIVLAAHDKGAAGKLSRLFQNRSIIKRYQALVLGNLVIIGIKT